MEEDMMEEGEELWNFDVQEIQRFALRKCKQMKLEIYLGHPFDGARGPLIWVLREFRGPSLRRIETVRHLELSKLEIPEWIMAID
jgi:hypothetical protein